MSTPIQTAVRSAKGGNGATTVAIALAVMVAQRHTDEKVMLISRDGLTAVGTESPLPNLTITRGATTEERAPYAHVIYDVETGDPFPEGYQDYIVVMRQCYLSVYHATAVGTPNGHVMTVIITEPGRALTCADLDHAMGFVHSAEVPWDPQVARAMDAGLLVHRLPHSLAVGLREVRDSVCWAGVE